jgi:conjugative transfer signal peptidase TraF
MNIPYKEGQQPMYAHPTDKINALAASSRQQSRYHRTINVLTALVLSGFSILFVSDWLGLRFNHSQSVAPGFYWVIDKPPEKGDYVSFCPAQDSMTQMAFERGYMGFGNCPSHTERLLKIVVGAGGDTIELTNAGAVINKALLPNTPPLTQDGSNRPLAPFFRKRLVLQPDELWVMTNRSPLSFDSRYFGPIRLAQVSDVVRPIWTWQ